MSEVRVFKWVTAQDYTIRNRKGKPRIKDYPEWPLLQDEPGRWAVLRRYAQGSQAYETRKRWEKRLGKGWEFKVVIPADRGSAEEMVLIGRWTGPRVPLDSGTKGKLVQAVNELAKMFGGAGAEAPPAPQQEG